MLAVPVFRCPSRWCCRTGCSMAPYASMLSFHELGNSAVKDSSPHRSAADASRRRVRRRGRAVAPGWTAAARSTARGALSAAADEITRSWHRDPRGPLRGSDPDFVVNVPSFESADVLLSDAGANAPTVMYAGDDDGEPPVSICDSGRAQGPDRRGLRPKASRSRMAGPTRPPTHAHITAQPHRQTDLHRMGSDDPTRPTPPIRSDHALDHPPDRLTIS